jgi:enoyl-CoA hydratase/carnithine racemase
VTRYEVTDRVATITLHRPDRLNAWTAQMNAEYRSCLQQASDDPGVRVVVVTGSGRGFCAGAESEDLAGHVERGAYRSWDADHLDRPGYGVRPEFDAELAYHFGVPKPIIAAVNGPAAGIGFALACYCDLRFAAAGAKLTTVTAEEADQLGLLTAVPADQLADRVGTYARMLATEVSPASMAASKRQVYEAFHTSAAEAVRTAEALIDPMMSGPDYREGVAALREKRAAVYQDLTSGRPDSGS